MMLIWLLIIPILGGGLAWWLGRRNAAAARWIALAATVSQLLLAISVWLHAPQSISLSAGGAWLASVNRTWFTVSSPPMSVHFHLALDGISLLLILLTGFLGVLSVLVSWREIRDRVAFFHLNLLLVLAGVTGVFLAMDLFLFYFFWELMLVPMYFLIAVWGHENRRYAANKFFIFTQLSGLLMLLAILGLVFAQGRTTGVYSFEYADLLGARLPASMSMLLMLGFFAAFAVKLPVFPFHPWLPDAHTEAPTAGSVVLAGLLLKTGAYGFIRFVIPLFPDAAARFAPVAMILAVIGIIYGAILAFAQSDFKRLVAYTSVSHLGFVLLGIFAWRLTWNPLALQGAVLQMLAHGLSTGGLFIVAGLLQERLHTRDMDRMGGLWTLMPRLGAAALLLALASLGLPGLVNFVAEYLILQGSFPASISLTAIATTGLIFATIYALWLVQRVFFGPTTEKTLPDLHPRELFMVGTLMLLLLVYGLYPQPLLNTAQSAIDGVRSVAQGGGR